MSDKDIQESEEPYKSVAIIIDRLYLKGFESRMSK